MHEHFHPLEDVSTVHANLQRFEREGTEIMAHLAALEEMHAVADKKMAEATTRIKAAFNLQKVASDRCAALDASISQFEQSAKEKLDTISQLSTSGE